MVNVSIYPQTYLKSHNHRVGAEDNDGVELIKKKMKILFLLHGYHNYLSNFTYQPHKITIKFKYLKI